MLCLVTRGSSLVKMVKFLVIFFCSVVVRILNITGWFYLKSFEAF